jgi:sugar lactone lactonase YvrE
MLSLLVAATLAINPPSPSPATPTAAAPAPALPTQVEGEPVKLEVVAELDVAPGNLTVTPSGRILFSLHPFGQPAGARIGEVLPMTAAAEGSTEGEGKARYRLIDEPWAGPVDIETGLGFTDIIGLRSDPKGNIWLLDLGQPAKAFDVAKDAPELRLGPKLVQWDANLSALRTVFPFAGNTFGMPAFTPRSFLQDLTIDPRGTHIYLADCGIGAGFDDPEPCLVVVELAASRTRRVLVKHPSVMPEADARMVIAGTEVLAKRPDGSTFAPRVGVNPIIVDARGEWVYYGAMHGTSVYKIKVADLWNDLLSPEELGARVVRHGPKGVSDGMTMDILGNIYVTDVNNHAIGMLDQQGRYRLIAQDKRLLNWPDGLACGPDGYIYAATNQLHKHAPLNAGQSDNKPPYYIVRFKAPHPVTVGR